VGVSRDQEKSPRSNIRFMTSAGTDPNDGVQAPSNEERGAPRPESRPATDLSVESMGRAADQVRRVYHHELALRTQKLLDSLAGLDIDGLKGVKDGLVVSMHPKLMELSREGFGLIVQDGACPGAITNALTRMNGAGRYLRGGVTVVSADARLLFGEGTSHTAEFHSVETGERMQFFTGAFGKIRDLPGSTILGVNGSIENGRVTVYLSDRGTPGSVSQFYFPPSPDRDPVKSWRAAQIGAAIAGLHFLEGWIEQGTRANRIVEVHSAELLLTERPRAAPEHEAAIRRIKDTNDQYFRQLRHIIRSGEHDGFIFGESFTGGAINSLFQSVPRMARYVDYAVVWYHDNFKEAFGVDRSYLNPHTIATPRTVQEAAFGLLDNPPSLLPSSRQHGIVGTRGAHTAITTSGWASLDTPGMADNFSVCVRSLWGGKSITYTGQLNVESSLAHPPSYARKEITKQLGVATALYLTGRALADLNPTCPTAFKRATAVLGNFIRGHAGLPLNVGRDSV